MVVAPLAMAEEGKHVIGVQAGHVGQQGNTVGPMYGNGLGYGVFFNYAGSDFLEFQMGFLSSRHTRDGLELSQHALSAAAQYNIDQLDIFVPYAKGGAEFVFHNQSLQHPQGWKQEVSPMAFGLLVGIGTQLLVSQNFMTGLDITYHPVFDASSSVGGVNYATVQSYLTVLVQFGYRLGGK
jgi:opacity protein-like surface antigen